MGADQMQKLYYCVLILFFTTQSFLAQQINKVIVSGSGGDHDENVKAAFIMGYASYNSSSFPGEINLYSYSLPTSFAYASQNNIDLIIRSTTNANNYVNLAFQYPSIKLVMPAGANEHIQKFTGDIITSPIVITGAGVDYNETAYSLEFFSIDPITDQNLSSYSNGYIAGQLTFIANTLHCSFDSARTLARIYGTENGVLDLDNGFGKILTHKVLEDIALPVELTSFTAKVIGKTILLKWQTATEINNYGFEIERKIINQTQNYITNWDVVDFINGHGNSNSPKDYSFIDQYAENAVEIHYRLKQIDNDGKCEYSDVIKINLMVDDFKLLQNYPNPFNPSTNISYKLPAAGSITLKVYDVLGNEIETLVDEFKDAGTYSVLFNSSLGLSSGVYIYKIEIKNNDLLYTMNKKMTLLK